MKTTNISFHLGSGKGTISKKLISGFNFHHLSTGDLLRDAITKKTPIGLEAQNVMATGGFVSDETVVKLALDSYNDILNVSRKSPRILFDGFPRTMWQAQKLDSMEPPMNIHLALYIDVPDTTIINRLSGRWVHAASGRTYASDYNPPKKVT
jgi:adenylate kinase family enzyme